MKITIHPNFDKSFRKRFLGNQKIIKKINERIEIFRLDQNNILLNDHQLKGAKREYRSFSVNGDIRIIYRQISADQAVLYDIGSHNQVYN